MSKRFGILNTYLDTLVSKMLVNDNLCKLLYYNTNDDIIAKPNLTQEQKLGLIGSNIFINKRVPIIQEEAKPLLMIRITDVDYNGGKYSYINDVMINMYIICANSVIETENGTRDLCIATALDDIFENSDVGDIGIGNMLRMGFSDLADLGTEYQGYSIKYLISDFNTQNVRNKWN